ncbi:MAG: hypothetical protein D8M59_15940 [Planctomycetes bacterium]|nr:hypothetical protein [Planctomycetota bacterium]
MLISVHLPKTAGTSFGAVLTQQYGDRLLRDYGDYPINTPVIDRHRAALAHAVACAAEPDRFADVPCIHGHFLPIKYLPLVDQLDEVRFVTWLRHPVDRVISHYEYWKRKYQPKTAPALQRQMVEEAWTLERFCLGPEMRNLYCQFLWGFPLDYFSFVGVTEYYNEEVRIFGRQFLDDEVDAQRLNTADTEPRHREPIEQGLRDRIAEEHGADMALYLRALDAYNKRKAT